VSLSGRALSGLGFGEALPQEHIRCVLLANVSVQHGKHLLGRGKPSPIQLLS